MSASATQSQSQPIDLSTLPTPQLTAVKQQLTQELQHLTTSFAQLKSAQGKFRECGRCVGEVMGGDEGGKGGGEGTPILVPLTPSLYVPGTLASTDTVLVDVGTGFYVEKTPSAAREFYSRKVEEVGRNLLDLEKIVQGKQGNLGVVEDVLRQKVISESGGSGGGDGGT